MYGFALYDLLLFEGLSARCVLSIVLARCALVVGMTLHLHNYIVNDSSGPCSKPHKECEEDGTVNNISPIVQSQLWVIVYDVCDVKQCNIYRVSCSRSLSTTEEVPRTK